MPLRKATSRAEQRRVERLDTNVKTAVPPNRLGQLLSEARLRTGSDLEQLAHRSEFTVGELSDLEAGHQLLDDDLIKRVTELYQIDCGPIVPQRSGLVIDLDDQLMTASSHALPLDSDAREHVLDRYLSLVYLLRNNTPGTKVTLRDEDLDILSASLKERRELIEEQLLLAMEPENETVFALFSWFRKRVWVPAAGALVGVTSVGALVMLSSSSPSGDFVDTQQLLADANPEPDADSTIAGVQLAPGPTSDLPASENTTADTTITASGVSSGSGSSTSSASPTSIPASNEPQIDRPASVVASESLAPTTEATEIGHAAEALLPFDWEEVLPGWEITYRGHNDSFRGLTYPYDQSIEIFVRESDTPERLASIVAHELGHAMDVTHMTAAERNQWLVARDISDSPWWADAFASDFQSGAGDFAEAFAVWAIGDSSSSEIAGQPTVDQLNLLESFFDNVL